MKSVRVRLLTSLFFAAAVAGCDSTSPQGVRVLATLDRSSVAMSGFVSVTVRATNASLRSVQGENPNAYGQCFHAFRVYKEGREVSVPSGACRFISAFTLVAWTPIELKPGATVTITDRWDPATSTLDGAPITPGTYTLVGKYHAGGAERTSAPVSITVMP